MGEPELVTFRILDERNGVDYSDPLPQTCPLEKWFAAVCDVPIAWFTMDNLARSCRQRIHLDAVMPYCLRALEFVPLLEDKYGGYLLSSVLALPSEYWSTHNDHRDAIRTVCRYALLEVEDDEDLTREIADWLGLHQSAIRVDEEWTGE